MPRFIVTASNEFNAGWLAYILGLDRPTDPLAADGWDTGMETPSTHAVRYVMETQQGLEANVRQYVVTREDDPQARRASP